MPKKRKDTRKGAETLRVPSLPNMRFDRGAERVASLLVVQGAEVDLGRHILCDRPVTIGRDDDTELPLSDGSISRRHCRVERELETGRYVLVDLGSTNGTSLNGRQVRERIHLSEGDKIFLGASVVKFGFSDFVDLQYQSRLEEIVTTDALTGLASRRQYDFSFDAMATRAEAEHSLLSILVMDMDGLKQINDSHGHQMGGYAIVEVSNIIRGVLEDHGLVCRYGGDEFVGCFPGLSQDQACALAEQVREQVADHHFVKDGIMLQPTISIGVATFPGDVDNPKELFTTADRALYRAKRAGRNCVATPDGAVGS